MMLPLVVLLPLAAALLLGLVPDDGSRASRNLAGALAMATTLASAGLLVALGPSVLAGEIHAIAVPWLPLAGADLGLRMDGLAWLFALLVTGMGALVLFYAFYYFGREDSLLRFLAPFMFFMAAMLGLVLADNLLLLAICWELTSLASFLLIGYRQPRADARQGARMALLVTGAGGLALLVGVLLVGQAAGSLKLDVVLAAGDQVRASAAYAPALILILLGVFTKSAQVPFHFWLPEAMAAPTPVSAYLHSATLVKAGVFLLARLHPALAGTDLWFGLVTGTGLATLLTGAYLAIFQHDLKGLLAYSTISQLGLIVLLFGLDEPLATVAGIFHILNHATFKASLFMAAGIIDHETGSRDMRRLNGLWKYMPVTAALAITSSLAMAGVPLLNGFLSKEMFFAETLLVERHVLVQVAIPVLATIAAALSVAYSARFVHDVFFNGEPHDLPRPPREPPAWMLVPVGVLALLCVLVGIFPQTLIGPLLETAATAAVGGPLPAYTLAIWHGPSLALFMSLLALGAGVTLYAYMQRIVRLHDIVHLPRGNRDVFLLLVNGLVDGARALQKRTESGTLRHSMVWLLICALVAGAWPLAGSRPGVQILGGTPANGLALILWSLALVANLAVLALHRQRLVALLVVGAIGLCVAIGFAGLSAPDLALTQLVVEVVSVILVLLALYYLPPSSPPGEPLARRLGDGVLAGLVGLGVAALAYAVMTRPSLTISGFYLANALPLAAGNNAVNVIIVDFRAFDTLGEITVLAIAGLLVAGALGDWRGVPASQNSRGLGPSFLLDLVAPVLLPLALCVALFFYLRGHNLPGGGFVAGLVAALGLLLLYVGRGITWVEARVTLDYRAIMGWGLLASGLTGLASLPLGYPFLTSSHAAPRFPWLGEVPLATAMGFDLGVLLTVAGASLVALVAIGKASAVPPATEPR